MRRVRLPHIEILDLESLFETYELHDWTIADLARYLCTDEEIAADIVRGEHFPGALRPESMGVYYRSRNLDLRWWRRVSPAAFFRKRLA